MGLLVSIVEILVGFVAVITLIMAIKESKEKRYGNLNIYTNTLLSNGSQVYLILRNTGETNVSIKKITADCGTKFWLVDNNQEASNVEKSKRTNMLDILEKSVIGPGQNVAYALNFTDKQILEKQGKKAHNTSSVSEINIEYYFDAKMKKSRLAMFKGNLFNNSILPTKGYEDDLKLYIVDAYKRDL